MTDDDAIDATAMGRLERMVGPEVLREVVTLYLENGPKRREMLETGVATGDLALVARGLHDIKSSAGMMGAVQVQRMAEKLEQLVRDGAAKDVATQAPTLIAAMQRADEALREAWTRRDS